MDLTPALPFINSGIEARDSEDDYLKLKKLENKLAHLDVMEEV